MGKKMTTVEQMKARGYEYCEQCGQWKKPCQHCGSCPQCGLLRWRRFGDGT